MNKQLLKRFFAKFYPFQYSTGIVILNYHSVGSNNPYSLPAKSFEEQIQYLKQHYSVIPLASINRTENLGNRIYIVITFDDGYEDNYYYAFPVLRKYDVPATIFLTSDYIINGVDITKNWSDYRGLKSLQIDQIKEMENSRIINFGSHGKTHKILGDMADAEFVSELVGSKKDLDTILVSTITNFAFPFGQRKDRGKRRDRLFKEAKYFNVCTTDWGINSFAGLEPYNLKRIRIDHNDTIEDFVGKITGKWGFVSWFQKIRNLI